MEEKMHKHKGVERANGTLRNHPVTRVHKDSYAQKQHNLVMKKEQKVKFIPKKDSKAKSVPKQKIEPDRSGNHKHKGMTDSRGNLRMHPISRVHKDKLVQKFHKKAINEQFGEIEEPEFVHPAKKIDTEQKSVQMLIDKDGYISIDLDSTNVKGLRVTFTRREGKKRKSVPLQIDNEPFKFKSGERITSKPKLIVDEQHSYY